MYEQKNLAEIIAYTIVAWLQTLGSTRFQLIVTASVLVVVYGDNQGELISASQLTQISVLIVSWLLGESIRPHASIKNNSLPAKPELSKKPGNTELLDEAIIKLNSISGPSLPIGPLIKACIDVLETARSVLVNFKRF